MKRSSCPSQRGFIPLKFGNHATIQKSPDASVLPVDGIKHNCNLFAKSDTMPGVLQSEADVRASMTQPEHPSPDDGHGDLATKRSPFSLMSKHQNTSSLKSSLKSIPQIKPQEEITSGFFVFACKKLRQYAI